MMYDVSPYIILVSLSHAQYGRMLKGLKPESVNLTLLSLFPTTIEYGEYHLHLDTAHINCNCTFPTAVQLSIINKNTQHHTGTAFKLT